MKLVESRHSIEQNFEGEQIDFTMKASAKAFHLVIAQLYSNPIQAIVRELSTNAYEAHQMVNDEKRPFDVMMPTPDKSEFVIRDYGPGLTPEQFKKIYTVVFESTKTGTNSMDGCFGLGSKSPFAYTKSYIVESFVDGKHYIYFVSLNDQDIPTLILGETVDTTEPNGLRITIPVAEKDIARFAQAATNIYQWFDVFPNIVRGKVDKVSYDIVYNNPKIQVVKKAMTIVKMGNVSYPIDTSIVKLPFTLKYNHGIILHAPKGSLSPAPSREALSYDNHTKTNLQILLKEAMEALEKDVGQQIASCKSIYQAMCQYSIFAESIGCTDLQNVHFNGGKYSVDNYVDVLNDYHTCFFRFDTNNRVAKNEGMYRLGKQLIDYIGQVYVIDTKTNFNQAIIFNENKSYGHVIKIHIDDTHLVDTLFEKDSFGNQLFDKSDLVIVSEINMPKKLRATSTKGQNVKNVITKWKYSPFLKDSWDNVEVDDKTVGYYVLTYENRIVVSVGANGKPDKTVEPKDVHDLVELSNHNLYGIKLSQKDMIAKLNLKPLTDYMKELTTNPPQKYLDYERKRVSTKPDFSTDFVKYMSLKDEELTKLVKDYEVLSKISYTSYDVREIVDALYQCSRFGYQYTSSPEPIITGKTLKSISGKYPLINTRETESYPVDIALYVDAKIKKLTGV